MPLEGRDGLIARFQKGYIPEAKDFRTLIDSTVNKKDDQFFGRWQRGMKYCNGDVVLYNKSLYMLDLTQKTENCPPEEVSQDDKEVSCICSKEPPTKGDCWCLLELLVDDNDWRVIEDEATGDPKIVYTLSADVGIGTDAPQSPLDVQSEVGSVQLQPNLNDAPAIRIIHFQTENEGEEDERVDIRLANQLNHHTNSLGYAFYRKAPTASGNENMAKQSARGINDTNEEPILILFATSTENGIPQVGIGTDDPKASLDVVAPDRGRMMVHPFPESADATALLLNTKPAGNGHYLLNGVNDDFAYLQTDANQGLRIIQGEDVSELEKNMGQGNTSVAIDKNGKVGIGTEAPRSELDIRDGDTGSIRADFSNDNVCLSVINERTTNTYSAMGVDDFMATFISDAPFGFVFRAGEKYVGSDDSYNPEVNIDQGEELFFIGPDGKTGIRTLKNPDHYDLDVNGQIRSLTSSILTNKDTITNARPIKDESMLEKVCELVPIRFKFKDKTNAAVAGEQIGLKASNVKEHLEEATNISGKQIAISYSNLTAVLVKAIQEQQEIIEDLNQRLCDLEEQAGNSSTAD